MKKNKRRLIYIGVIMCMAVSFFSVKNVLAEEDDDATATVSDVTETTTEATTEAETQSTTEEEKLATPKLNSTVAANGGIKVSWGEVTDASGYAIFRKNSSSDWSLIGTTASTDYTDTTAKTGTTYYYTVRAYRGSYETAMKNKYKTLYWSGRNSTGVKGKYLKSPALKSAKATASGTTITWSLVNHATGYVVYRKESGGSWKRIGNTTETSYTDKATLTSGTTYYYRVRSYTGTLSKADANKNSSLYWSYTNAKGLKNVYLSKPSLDATTAADGGIKVSWDSVSGASGYVVYRKTSSSSWIIIGKTTGTSYTDTTTKTGTTYYYTARAYKGSYQTAKNNKYNAAYWGGYNNTGVKGKYIKSPTLKSAKATASGTTITWSAVTNASGYAVYRKESGGSWKRIGTTTETSYTDKDTLTSGTIYYYRVKTYSGTLSDAIANLNNSLYWSYTNVKGLKNTYLSEPELSSAIITLSGATSVTWSSVTGASGYVVYRKESGGSWMLLGKTTDITYTDKTANAGTTYYYTARAYRGSYTTAKNDKYNAAYWGGYNYSGIIAEAASGTAADSSSSSYLNTDEWLARVILEYLGDTGIACNVFVNQSLALAGGTDYTIANMVKYTDKSSGGILLNMSYTCSAWANASVVTGTAVLSDGTAWQSETSVILNDSIVSFSYDNLEPGDIILYYKSSQSTPSHVSLYIGQFDDADAVISYLVSIGISKSTATSYVKTWGTYYGNDGTYWCIEGGMGSSSEVYICNSTYCIPASSSYTYGTKIVKMNK